MGLKDKKEKIELMKAELKAAEIGYKSKSRAGKVKLFKLALLVVIAAIIAGIATGRIPMPTIPQW
ncbi:MAG: hypothetical protein ACYTBJ_04250 [Planctomycetota bacterium]|jgi:hypothetical protein